LTERKDTYDDPHAAAVTSSAEQIDPRNVGSLPFESEGLLDFIVLKGNQWVRDVTTSVVLGNNSLGVFIFAAVDQPTRRFGEEPHEYELDDG
jgi:hypothetical protein